MTDQRAIVEPGTLPLTGHLFTDLHLIRWQLAQIVIISEKEVPAWRPEFALQACRMIATALLSLSSDIASMGWAWPKTYLEASPTQWARDYLVSVDQLMLAMERAGSKSAECYALDPDWTGQALH